MQKQIFKFLQEAGTIHHDWDGEPAVLLQLALTGSLYYDGLETREQKEAVIQLLEEYASLMDGNIRWTTNPASNRFKKIKNLNSYTHPREWVPDRDLIDRWHFLYTGGIKPTDASDVYFSASGGPKDEPSHGRKGHSLFTVYFHFPVTFMERGADFFPSLLTRWAEILPPYHGRFGFAYASHDYFANHRVGQLAMTQALFSHPGLNYRATGEAIYHKGGLSEGIKCADWLLLLSPPFMDKLGGKDRIAKDMQPYPTREYQGGLLLQAGDYPQLGVAEPGWSLPEYQHLARVVEPIRARNLTPYMYEAELNSRGRYEAVTSRAMMDSWCERFSPGAIYPAY